MLNRDLLDNVEIARLKLAIKNFKEYDSKRKQVMSELQVEIGHKILYRRT